MKFGPQIKKVESWYLYILLFAYFYFTKICEPLVTFAFNCSILNIHLSTIPPFCLYFTFFLVKTGWGLGVIFWLLVKRGGGGGGCPKILYDVWGISRNFALLKHVLSPPPPPPPPRSIHNEFRPKFRARFCHNSALHLKTPLSSSVQP